MLTVETYMVCSLCRSWQFQQIIQQPVLRWWINWYKPVSLWASLFHHSKWGTEPSWFSGGFCILIFFMCQNERTRVASINYGLVAGNGQETTPLGYLCQFCTWLTDWNCCGENQPGAFRWFTSNVTCFSLCSWSLYLREIMCWCRDELWEVNYYRGSCRRITRSSDDDHRSHVVLEE